MPSSGGNLKVSGYFVCSKDYFVCSQVTFCAARLLKVQLDEVLPVWQFRHLHRPLLASETALSVQDDNLECT